MRKGVLRPGHVQIRVMEMEPAVKHYTELLGVIETHRDQQGRVYLKGWTEPDLFSVVLLDADEAGVDFNGIKLRDEETISALGSDLKAWEVDEIGRASRRDRVCRSVCISGVAVTFKQKHITP